VNPEFMVRVRVYAVFLQTLIASSEHVSVLVEGTMPPVFLKLWTSPFICIYYVPYFLFALLCDQYALQLLLRDPMFPPMGRGKKSKPQNSVLADLFLLALYV